MTFSSSMTTAKIEGEIPAVPWVEDNYQAAIAQNPGNVWYWQWAIQPTDRASTSVFNVYFMLTFMAEFTNPVNLALLISFLRIMIHKSFVGCREATPIESGDLDRQSR